MSPIEVDSAGPETEEPELGEAVVLITGAGRGLGRAFALAFGRLGRRVAIADIDAPSAESVAAEVRRRGGEALAVAADVADPQSVDEMARAVEQEWESPTVLVNNAARFADLPLGPFTEITPRDWDAVMAVNVKGAFLCARALVPGMTRRGYGKIINMSSSTVWIGRAGYLHYVTSKAALLGLTRALATELGPAGVRVNAVTPGATRTEVERSTMSPERWAAVAEQAPLKRAATPGDIVGAVLFLASRASDFITGQVLNVDGGRSYP